jgi:hypothetical protein
MSVFFIFFYDFFIDKLLHFLGHGTFGKCYCAEKSGKRFAIKSVDIETEELEKSADLELENFNRVNGKSPYLIELIDCFDMVFFLV